MLYHRIAPGLPVALTILASAIAVAPVLGQSDRKISRLADGVYAIEHRDGGDGAASGNTTVIVGDRQVLVIDAGFLPSAAREDIAQIRKWTHKPVTFLVNTHFHNDHNLANRVYMDSFPALTVIAHVDTKEEMDRFGPGSVGREERGVPTLQQMLSTGKNGDGTALSEADKGEVARILARRKEVIAEIKPIVFQSATLSFDHDFEIDLGNRVVQIKFLGRGNTPGDAVVYLPVEKIAIVGDLVVSPVPYFYDGYPREWIQTLQRIAELDASTVVPGHGAPFHDKGYIYLMRDVMKSAVDQVNEALRKSGPAMFRTVDDIKASVDLSSFRSRFAGQDADRGAAFDAAAATLVRLVFREASLR